MTRDEEIRHDLARQWQELEGKKTDHDTAMITQDTSVERLAVEKGVLTPEELATGIAVDTGESAAEPLSPEAVLEFVRTGTPYRRTTGRVVPRYQPNHAVARVDRAGHPAYTCCNADLRTALGSPLAGPGPERWRPCSNDQSIPCQDGWDVYATGELRGNLMQAVPTEDTTWGRIKHLFWLESRHD